MIMGIALGLLFAGLFMGALSGSIMILILFAAAGLLIAVIPELVKAQYDRATRNFKLKQFPPYGY